MWSNTKVLVLLFALISIAAYTPGVVTNSSTSNTRAEAMSVTTGGVVTEVGGSDWVNGNAVVAGSQFTFTMKTGLWTGIPICVCSTAAVASWDSYAVCAASSTTVLVVKVGNWLQGVSQRSDLEPFNVICLGVR